MIVELTTQMEQDQHAMALERERVSQIQAQMSLATPTGGLQKNISFKMNRPWGQSASLEALELQ